MRFPKKVYIGGVPYCIKYCKLMKNVDFDKKEERLLGATEFDLSQIRIYSNRKKEQIWKTLWHEALHAMIYELKLWRHIKSGGYNEEHLIDGLSTLIQGLRWED